MRRTPLSEIPVDYPGGWPALLAGTPLAGEPTQSITFEQFLALYDPPGPPTQALRDLTLEDIVVLRRHAARQTPARPRSCSAPHRVATLHFGTPRRGATARRRHRGRRRRARRSVSGSDDDAAGARRRPRGRAVLAAHPDLRRIPGGQHRRLRRRPGARRPAERAQPVRHRRSARSPVTAAIDASPAVGCGADRRHPGQRRQPRRRRLRSPRPRRRLHRTASTAPAARRSADATRRRRAASPGRKLQDVGRAFFDHTVAGDPADHARRRSPPRCPPALDINDVIVGIARPGRLPLGGRRPRRPPVCRTSPAPGRRWTGTSRISIASARGRPRPVRHDDHRDAAGRVPLLPPDTGSPRTGRAQPAHAGRRARSPARASATDPTGQVLVWTLAAIQADTDYTLSFRTTPGLELGQSTAVPPRSRSRTVQRPRRTSSTVVDTGDAGGRPGLGLARSRATSCTSAMSIDANDLDLYGFDSTPSAQVGVRLSHLAGDGDLVVYGPATDRPATRRRRCRLAPPHRRHHRCRRGPRRLGRRIRARARHRRRRATDRRPHGRRPLGSAQHRRRGGRRDRARPAAGQLVQHVVSNLPYVLRVRQVDPPNTPACAAYARTGGVAGTMPDLTRSPADLATVILVNQQRLGDTFGAAAAGDVMASAGNVRRTPRRQRRRDPRRGRTGGRRPRTQLGTPTRASPTERTRSSTRSPASSSGSATAPCRASPPTRAGQRRRSSVATTSCRWRASTTPLGSATRPVTPTSSTSTARTSARSSTSHFLSDDPYGDLDPIAVGDAPAVRARAGDRPSRRVADADHRPARRLRRRLRSARRQSRIRRRIRLHDRWRQARCATP